MPERYRLSTAVEPFMTTQRERNGYTTSYAQIRIHHGTHVDFPAHVGLDSELEWDLSGPAAIRRPAELVSGGREPRLEDHFEKVPHALLFETGDENLPLGLVESLADSEAVGIIGTDAAAPGARDVHRRLLRSNVYILENLQNLDAPSSREGYMYCFPLLVEGCDDGAVASVVFEPQ